MEGPSDRKVIGWLEVAEEIYAREPCRRTFHEDLELHMTGGFVRASADYFAMARPVMSTAQVEEIIDPGKVFHWIDCDCWHVYAVAGDIVAALGDLPWPLQLISFERSNVLRFYPLGEFLRIAQCARTRKSLMKPMS